MGIECGRIFYGPFRRGIYVKQPKSYNIYIDGEYIRFKGLTSDNATSRHPEEAIASSAFTYLLNLKKAIEYYLHTSANKVIVVMDGERVANKCTNRPLQEHDVQLIRTKFMCLCHEFGFDVNELEKGEAELNMYLSRDKTQQLNVFVTADSDMFSICYDHVPMIERDDLFAFEKIEAPDMESINHTVSNYSFVDYNMSYDAKTIECVRDSCIWFSCCPKRMEIVAFDGCARRIGIEALQMRTMIVMCGTDFSNAMFTPTAVQGIFDADAEDLRQLNQSNDVVEIVAILIYLALKNGGRLKPLPSNINVSDSNDASIIDQVTKIIDTYCEYIETSTMRIEQMPRLNCALIMRDFVYAMRAKCDDFNRNNLRRWTECTTIDEALTHFRLYVGAFTRNFMKIKRIKNDGIQTKQRQQTIQPINVSVYDCL